MIKQILICDGCAKEAEVLGTDHGGHVHFHGSPTGWVAWQCDLPMPEPSTPLAEVPAEDVQRALGRIQEGFNVSRQTARRMVGSMLGPVGGAEGIAPLYTPVTVHVALHLCPECSGGPLLRMAQAKARERAEADRGTYAIG